MSTGPVSPTHLAAGGAAPGHGTVTGPTVGAATGPTTSAASGPGRAVRLEDAYRLVILVVFSLMSVATAMVVLPSNLPQMEVAPAWLLWGVQVPFLLSPVVTLVGPAVMLRDWNRQGWRPGEVTRTGRRLVGIVLAVHVVANLVVLAAGDATRLHEAAPVSGAHVLTTSALAVPVGVVAAVAGPWWVGLVGLVAAVLQVVVRVQVGREHLLDCYLDTSFTLLLGVLVGVALVWVVNRARDLDAENGALVLQREASVRSAARLTARRRVARFLHDRVIAALVLTRPELAVPIDRLNDEAARALAALGPRRDDGGTRTLEDLADALAQVTHRRADALHRFVVVARGVPTATATGTGTGAEVGTEVGAGAGTTGKGPGKGPGTRAGKGDGPGPGRGTGGRRSVDAAGPVTLPARVWADLVSAADEAVRNVCRHAAPPGGTATCLVTVTGVPGRVDVEVRDDGVGFDPDAVPTDRLGLRGSVMERMRAVRGGSATVTSHLGEGTQVVLTWCDDDVHATPAVDPREQEPHPVGAAGVRGAARAAGEPASGSGPAPRPGPAGTGGPVAPPGARPPEGAEEDRLARRMRAALAGTQVRAGALVFLVLMWSHGLAQTWAYRGAWRSVVALVLVSFLVVLPLVSARVEGDRWLGAGCLTTSAVAPLVLMSGWYARPWPANQGWVLAFAVLALTLLLFRGSAWLALGCFVLLVSSFLVGCAAAGADVPRLVVEYLPYQVGAFLSEVVATGAMRLTEQRVVHALGQTQAVRAEQVSRAEEEAERERLMDAVVAEASPVLGELAVVRVVDPGLRRRSVVLEARLRDRIRAPRLALDPVLGDWVDRARERGATVVLMDDSAQAGTPVPGAEARPLPVRLREAVIPALASLGPGERVVVRLCPPHAPVLATVQVSGVHGLTKLVEVPREEGGDTGRSDYPNQVNEVPREEGGEDQAAPLGEAEVHDAGVIGPRGPGGT